MVVTWINITIMVTQTSVHKMHRRFKLNIFKNIYLIMILFPCIINYLYNETKLDLQCNPFISNETESKNYNRLGI